MAAARCEMCGSPKGLKNSYLHPHPLVAPQPVLCGSQNCTKSAVIWLTDEEEADYHRGVRFFHLANHHREATVS